MSFSSTLTFRVIVDQDALGILVKNNGVLCASIFITYGTFSSRRSYLISAFVVKIEINNQIALCYSF
jgi:hypothetical protein